MYSVYSERQADCECVKSLAPRSSYRHMQAYKVVAEQISDSFMGIRKKAKDK